MDKRCVPVGIIAGLELGKQVDGTSITSIIIEIGKAHCPASGVKVYAVVPIVVVLIVEGLHVPVTPLIEVNSKFGGFEFIRRVVFILKVGVIKGVTLISALNVELQIPFDAVTI